MAREKDTVEYERYKKLKELEATERDRIAAVAGQAVADEIDAVRSGIREAKQHVEKIKNDLRKSQHALKVERRMRGRIDKKVMELKKKEGEEFAKSLDQEIMRQRAEFLVSKTLLSRVQVDEKGDIHVEPPKSGEKLNASIWSEDKDKALQAVLKELRTAEEAQVMEKELARLAAKTKEGLERLPESQEKGRDIQALDKLLDRYKQEGESVGRETLPLPTEKHIDRLESELGDWTKTLNARETSSEDEINKALAHLSPEVQDKVVEELEKTDNAESGKEEKPEWLKERLEKLGREVNPHGDLFDSFLEVLSEKTYHLAALATEAAIHSLAEVGQRTAEKLQKTSERAVEHTAYKYDRGVDD